MLTTVSLAVGGGFLVYWIKTAANRSVAEEYLANASCVHGRYQVGTWRSRPVTVLEYEAETEQGHPVVMRRARYRQAGDADQDSVPVYVLQGFLASGVDKKTLERLQGSSTNRQLVLVLAGVLGLLLACLWILLLKDGPFFTLFYLLGLAVALLLIGATSPWIHYATFAFYRERQPTVKAVTRSTIENGRRIFAPDDDLWEQQVTSSSSSSRTSNDDDHQSVASTANLSVGELDPEEMNDEELPV